MECFCDYEMPAVYANYTRVARKQHVCEECRREIHVGESYERVFGVWDGSCSVFKTCARCISLRDYVKAHVPCLCWQHGNTIEDCMETAREYAREAPGLLFGAYRRLSSIKRNEAKP